MKNPFVKENNNGLIAAVLIGSIAAGAIAYLYLTESGSNTRHGFKKKMKNKVKDAASGAISKKTGISKKLVKTVADHVIK